MQKVALNISINRYRLIAIAMILTKFGIGRLQWGMRACICICECAHQLLLGIMEGSCTLEHIYQIAFMSMQRTEPQLKLLAMLKRMKNFFRKPMVRAINFCSGNYLIWSENEQTEKSDAFYTIGAQFIRHRHGDFTLNGICLCHCRAIEED